MIAMMPSLMPGSTSSQMKERVTHRKATPRKTASTAFSSCDIAPSAFFSLRISSAPPGRCLNRTLNETLVRKNQVKASRRMTMGTPNIIHWPKEMVSPNSSPVVAARIARGGVPMRVPRPPMVAA